MRAAMFTGDKYKNWGFCTQTENPHNQNYVAIYDFARGIAYIQTEF